MRIIHDESVIMGKNHEGNDGKKAGKPLTPSKIIL